MSDLTLGEQVRHARGSMGLRELARRIGITPSYLSDIEHDRRRPSAKVWEEIGSVIRVESSAHVADRARELRRRDPELAAFLASPAPDPGAELREALVEAVMPLEVIAGQNRMKPYRELSPDFIDTINRAIGIVRAALAPSAEPPETAE